MWAKGMKISQSIRSKVFVIFGSFTLLLTSIYTGMNIMIAYVVEDEVLEKVLAYEANVIESRFRQDAIIIQPRVDYMKLYLNPLDAPKEIADAYNNKTLTSEVFTKNKMHYHIQHLYFNQDSSALLVAEVTPFLTVTNASDEILSVFLLVIMLVVALSLWFAFRIATKTTKPISLLTKEVMMQQSQFEPMQFSAKQTPDEIGFLANTIDSALIELRMLLKRESDFNRDVSHELRTPLTVLNNTLALAASRTVSNSEIMELQNATNQLNQIVTTLLTLARSESVELENIKLRALLEDCAITLHSKLINSDFNINLEVKDGFWLKANKQLLILLVNNLIENAVEHSSSNNLLVRLKHNKLYFINEIATTISKNVVKKLTQENVKKTDSVGIGQGLYLVKRIVESLGWSFEITSESGCYQFVIVFSVE
jgi:signal transduction histidine kinase